MPSVEYAEEMVISPSQYASRETRIASEYSEVDAKCIGIVSIRLQTSYHVAIVIHVLPAIVPSKRFVEEVGDVIYTNEAKRALGKRLAKARTNAKLSQEKASRLSHVSVSTISRYENGEVKAYSMGIRRLALTYGVSIDWLLGMSETMEPA